MPAPLIISESWCAIDASVSPVWIRYENGWSFSRIVQVSPGVGTPVSKNSARGVCTRTWTALFWP